MASVLANVGRILSADSLKTKDVLWLLSVNLGSREFRFSSETVVVSDADGVKHPYYGSLEPISYETNFELFKTDADVPSIPINVIFPVSIAGLAADGVHLSGGTGELSLWLKDSNLEDRVVVVKGRLRDPSYGDDGEPASFNVESDGFVDNALFPDSAAVVSEKAWPNATENAIGATYPFVFGTPGLSIDSEGTILKTMATPAIPIEYRGGGTTGKVLIAGHRVTAEDVVVVDVSDDPPTEIVAEVVHEADGLGRICALAVLGVSGASNCSVEDGHEYYAKWTEGGGGFPSRRSNRVGLEMGDAGELMQYLVSRSTIKNDEGRMAAVADLLQGYKVAGYISERTSPWAWIVDNLLPLLPISIGVSGSEGIYPIFWPMDATDQDTVLGLVESSAGEGNCVRIGPVSYEDIDIANEIRFDFANDIEKGLYKAQTTVTGSPISEDGGDYVSGMVTTTRNADGSTTLANPIITGWPNAYARFSFHRHGKRQHQVSSPIVYNRATADAVVSWMTRALATPPRVVQYDVENSLAWLQPGDVVKLTDVTIRITNQISIIRSVAWNEDAIRLTILIIEDPFRDSNSAP